MTDASAIRKPRTPNTLSSGSTTALLAAVAPILHVPTLALPAGSTIRSHRVSLGTTELYLCCQPSQIALHMYTLS